MAILYAYSRFIPHLLMILVQIGYSFLYFLAEAAFSHGMSPHVFVTYRYIVGSLVMFLLAYFLERKVRPKLTLVLFLEIFVLSLLGLEIVNLRNPRGIAKIVGTLLSLAGVLTITLYKGPEVQSLQGAPIHIKSNASQQNWVKGSILLVVSCITWSLWFIMQAYTLKRYPAQLSLSAWINGFAAAQSAVFTVFMQHKLAAWSIGSSIVFWSIIYAGVISCGLTVTIQLWCTEQKGPVFVTMFSPLATVMVAILAYFLFGEELHAGSILGGAVVIIGLYMLLWGKEKDGDRNKSQKQSLSTNDEEKLSHLAVESSAGRDNETGLEK
ncbi:PREDICTED: WAT1-related protein At4g08300-like isoform X3 [Populus euphratica]|uniref:WAT1-related protein n=1 Tax=Populus euphratica TaxID=75702 RepID=A0AAJ6UGM9_POPEU|nr:PREDICTED: WAT1-related protein At4g08300-like isoform X3 [Populus euphratica]